MTGSTSEQSSFSQYYKKFKNGKLKTVNFKRVSLKWRRSLLRILNRTNNGIERMVFRGGSLWTSAKSGRWQNREKGEESWEKYESFKASPGWISGVLRSSEAPDTYQQRLMLEDNSPFKAERSEEDDDDVE